MMEHEFTKAVIVAAGRGTRLGPLTARQPKALLDVGGETILARAVRLLRAAGVTSVAIVVGFEREQIVARHGAECRCLTNPLFARCNNLGSLWFARDFVGDDPFVHLHGDLVFSPELLAGALAVAAGGRDAAVLATDFGPVDDESMKVHTDGAGRLTAAGKELAPQPGTGEWIGLTLVRESRRLFAIAEEILLAGGHDAYDSAAFVRLAAAAPVVCAATGGQPWREVDDATDYAAARALFP